jgi:hypothetical protein
VITLSATTVAKNGADDGGGVLLYSNTGSEVDNCTIAFNTARMGGEGGGMWGYLDSNNDPIVVISTVIADNTAGHGGVGQDLFMGNGTITADYSLIDSFTPGSVVGSDDLENLNPMLGALTKNGGPTLTCLPSLVSPLLGAGSNPNKLTQDQRGHAREVGGTTDIGAVEEA